MAEKGRKIAIIGFGAAKFKARWIDKTYYEPACDAARPALEDAGIPKDEIEGEYVSVEDL